MSFPQTNACGRKQTFQSYPKVRFLVWATLSTLRVLDNIDAFNLRTLGRNGTQDFTSTYRGCSSLIFFIFCLELICNVLSLSLIDNSRPSGNHGLFELAHDGDALSRRSDGNPLKNQTSPHLNNPVRDQSFFLAKTAFANGKLTCLRSLWKKDFACGGVKLAFI